MLSWRVLAALALGLVASGPAMAASAQDGAAALRRQEYAKALAILGPLGQGGNPVAQTYLGYMYANGYGLPLNYIEAARWFRLASEQGAPVRRSNVLPWRGHSISHSSDQTSPSERE